MWCVLTKTNKNFDLPVVFKGSNNAVLKFIQERDDLWYQKNIFTVWSRDELMDVGIARFEEPKMPVSMMSDGPVVDMLSNGIVTRKAPWIDDPNYVAPDPLPPLKASHIVSIKTEANRRIIEIVPEWKQRNLTAQAAQMAKQVADGTPLTVEQQAAWDAGEAIWTKVAAIRAKSDELELSLDVMDLETMQSFDATKDEAWS